MKSKSFLRMQWLLSLLFTLLFYGNSRSEVYPIQLTTQLVPPYSGYLTDYCDPMNEKFRIILVLNDYTIPSYQVKLSLEIKSTNGSVTSKYSGVAITLTPGVPVMLSGMDLQPYLLLSNLDFKGIDPVLYEQRKMLPEGFYTFCVKAYDYYNPNNKQVSNESCSSAFITLAEPPLLNIPICNSVLTPLFPQLITFNWTPLHLSSPNITGTQYLFELFDNIPANANPNDIVQSLPPFYSLVVDQPFMILGPADPALKEGNRYAWRVKVLDKSGRDLFKNNGYSAVCSFKFGNLVEDLIGKVNLVLKGDASTWAQAMYNWTGDGNITEYTLRLRKKGFDWLEYKTAQQQIKINDLEAENTYEAQVKGTISDTETDWSNTVEVTLPKKPVPVCDVSNIQQNVQLSQPLLNALPGMHFVLSGEFDFVPTQIYPNGPPGHYKGLGKVKHYIGGSPGFWIRVRFDDIYVDDNHYVQDGTVMAITGGIEKWENNLLDEQFGGNNTGDVTTGNVSTNEQVNFSANNISSSVNADGTGNITITGTGGQSQSYNNQPLPFTVEDKDGKLFYADKNGESGVAGQKNFMSPLDVKFMDVLSKKGTVYFKGYKKQNYGFDEWKSIYSGKTLIEREYQLLSDSAKTAYYHVPQKSIKEKGFDQCEFELLLNDYKLNKDSLLFVSSKGTRYFTKGAQLKLIGSEKNDAQEIYAFIRQNNKIYSLGKLKVPSYELLQKQVVLVPVTVLGKTASLKQPDIEQQLNNFYKAFCIEYKVKIDNVFTDNTWDLNKDYQLAVKESGVFSQYTTEMKALNKAYKDQRGTDKQTAYLFVLPRSDEEGTLGDMPRSKQFGYIFTSPLNGGAGGGLIAHELAHGLYKLQHTWENGLDLAKGTTDNILDYNQQSKISNLQFYKYQWDQCHDPGMKGTLFDEEGEGMLVSGYCNEYSIAPAFKEIIDRAKDCDSGVDDDWSKLTLGSDVSSILMKICVAPRTNLLKCITSGTWVDGDDEKAINQLLLNTPLSQTTTLKENLLKDQLLKKMIAGVDGEEFVEMTKIIASWQGEPQTDNWEDAIKNKNLFFFRPIDALPFDYTDNNELVFKSRKNFTIGYDQSISVKSPFDRVLVVFESDFIIGGKKIPAGTTNLFTGLELYTFFNEAENKNTKITTSMFADIPLYFIGLGEIKAAKNLANLIKILKTIKGFTTITIATTGIVMAAGLEDELTLTPEGKEIMGYWIWFNLAYAGAEFSPKAISSMKGLYQSTVTYLKKPGISAKAEEGILKMKMEIEAMAKEKGVETLIEDGVISKGRVVVKDGLEILNGVKAFRMSKGTNPNKIIVIGRNMDDVRLYKKGLESKGLKIEIFDGDIIPQLAKDDWKEKTLNGTLWLTDKEILSTQMYIENQKWIENMVNTGYDIYDIGNLKATAGNGLNPGHYSVFYDMEGITVFTK